MPTPLTPATFVEKWQRTKLPERAASQEHFLDLCQILDQPTPAQHDPVGAEYAFEKGITISIPGGLNLRGEHGYADVWWNGKFGWEYKRKGKYKSLDDAYAQLQRYREALNNPPLLIVSDITTTIIHTNFTNAANLAHTITLDDIQKGPGLQLLRRAFTDPESFRPSQTTEDVTQKVATDIGKIARRLQDEKHDPHDIAHFLMKCMFCLFAEDVPGLLPSKLFKKLLAENNHDPERFTDLAQSLFQTMATGGNFGLDKIPYFNGGLFDDAPPIKLSSDDLGVLNLAANQNWAQIEPSILGTLFERSLDPDKRAQIGAHYTSKEDILLVINPVIIDPLKKQWQKLKSQIESQLQNLQAQGLQSLGSPTAKMTSRTGKTTTTISPLHPIHDQLSQFLASLSSLKILDPACGSGNFLYVAIQQLLSLEKEIITFAAQPPISLRLLPRVRPTQLLGIEINPYAAELAQVSIWIGFLQWMYLNGFPTATDVPILSTLRNIENKDAVLENADAKNPCVPNWPDADFIVGNPPWLGSTKFKEKGISDEYKSAIESLYSLRGKADLCCCWFEYARRKLEANPNIRVGLLGNTTIRFGVARDVLDRIKQSGDIFNGWSNKEWVNDGAHVRTTIVCFDNGSEKSKSLDGYVVPAINADMTATVDVTQSPKLPENHEISFEGDQKGGPFDIGWQVARQFMRHPNPIPRNNASILTPRLIANDIAKRWDGGWVIDFGVDCDQQYASQFAAPFEYLKKAIDNERAEAKKNKKPKPPLRKKWWLHKCARPELRSAIRMLNRFLVTPRVATHRFFVWVPKEFLPDSRLFAFARDDDFMFGTLSSCIHEVWSLAKAPPHGEGNDPTYSATLTFETFPLPWPPGKENTIHATYARIAAAAKELNDLRERWLNPPELLDPLARILDAQDDFSDVPPEARPLIRHSALMAQAAQSPNLKKRTLTNLYNERPTWLKLAHQNLDQAALAAYAHIDPEGHWQESWATLYTDTGAGSPLPPTDPRHAERLATDQKILTNLLRLNHQRADQSNKI